MGKRGLVGSLTIIALAGGFTSLSHAQTELERTECDRLISALEGMGPAEAYEALQEMRVYRQGNRYKAYVDAARALQVRSTTDDRLPVAELAEMNVFNEKDEQVGDVDRLA